MIHSTRISLRNTRQLQTPHKKHPSEISFRSEFPPNPIKSQTQNRSSRSALQNLWTFARFLTPSRRPIRNNRTRVKPGIAMQIEFPGTRDRPGTTSLIVSRLFLGEECTGRLYCDPVIKRPGLLMPGCVRRRVIMSGLLSVSMRKLFLDIVRRFSGDGQWNAGGRRFLCSEIF